MLALTDNLVSVNIYISVEVSMSKPIALVIEDDANLSILFASVMEMIGFESEIVEDSRTAMTRIALRQPSLVLLDMQMPYITGQDVLRQIRADERFAKLKVMMVTANSRATDEQDLETLADVILIKPVTFAQLKEFALRLVPPVPAVVE